MNWAGNPLYKSGVNSDLLIQSPLSKEEKLNSETPNPVKNQKIAQVTQDCLQPPVSVSKKSISATPLNSGKNVGSSLKKADANEKLRNDLNRINHIRKKNLPDINEFRVQLNKSKTTETIDAEKIIQDLDKIQEVVTPVLKKLTKKAQKEGVAFMEIGEQPKVGEEKKVAYRLTIDKKGSVYVHVPKSSFARGGKKEVKAAINLNTREMVVRAVETKKIKTPEETKKIKTPDLSSNPEVRVSQLLKNHPHIGSAHTVTLKQKKNSKDSYNIGTLSPFFDGGDLTSKVLSKQEVLSYGLQAAKGLKAMHKKGLVHKDVKPENMMLKGNRLFIIDFGSTVWKNENIKNYKTEIKKLNAKLNNLKGEAKNNCLTQMNDLTRSFKSFVRNSDTVTYQRSKVSQDFTPYELNHPRQSAKKCDVYSLGISLLHMLYLKEINQESSLEKQHDLLMKKVDEFKQTAQDQDTPLQQLIRQMIQDDPEKIPKMSQVVKQLKQIQRNTEKDQVKLLQKEAGITQNEAKQLRQFISKNKEIWENGGKDLHFLESKRLPREIFYDASTKSIYIDLCGKKSLKEALTLKEKKDTCSHQLNSLNEKFQNPKQSSQETQNIERQIKRQQALLTQLKQQSRNPNFLGKGADKTVTRALNFETGQLIAKATVTFNTDINLDIETIKEIKAYHPAVKEAEILAKLKGEKGIMNCFSSIHYEENGQHKFALFMEMYNGGELKDVIGQLKPEEKMNIIEDLLLGLKVIHEKNIVHNDLKTDNILLYQGNKERHAVLMDFSKGETEADLSSKITTEQKKAQLDTKKRAEVQFLGVVLHTLYFDGKEKDHLKIRKRENFPEPLDKSSLEHLIWRMLAPVSTDRPTVSEALDQFNKIKKHQTSS